MPSNLDQIRDQQRETWDQFSAGWKKWDEMVLGWLAPFGEAMIRHANLKEDSRVLDVAAGTGEPGLSAAALVPQGHVTVTDLSERMLAAAAENAARRGLRNFETQVCDAGALPFADASFDAVLCRFGFMFFPEVASAAREFARVAKPGARVCAAVWNAPEKNAWATTIMGTIAAMWRSLHRRPIRRACSAVRQRARCVQRLSRRACATSTRRRYRRSWFMRRRSSIGSS